MKNVPKRPGSRSLSYQQAGFSFVELITVVLLIGILSVVAVARFSGSSGFAEFTYQNRLISALRNMQQRAMQDSRSGFCYQINIVGGAVSPAFGPPSTNYSAGNQTNTCASNIDTSVDFLATTSTEIADENLTLTATDNSNSNVTFIGFDGLGRPLSNINNCSAGCRVEFAGETAASVCIESQGYIHAVSPMQQNSHGFTLIELIAGIVVFAVVLTIVTSLVANQSRQSIDPIWQVKAIELGQSLLNEINAKAFDENSDLAGGTDRCNETTACTTSGNLGSDSGEVRSGFDDIDDFNGLDATGSAITNSLGETISGPDGNFYQGFRAQVIVFYDDNADGINDDDLNQDGSPDTGALIGNQKLIRVVITTPGGDEIPFSSFRTNF